MTINQSYTPAQRKKIAGDLRGIKDPTNWILDMPKMSVTYVQRVLCSHYVDSFFYFLYVRNLNWLNYPGGESSCIREALNRLADELEATK